jgi:hypothetical protein
VLKILEKRFEAYNADSPEAKSVIDLVQAALVSILKLCRASSKLSGDGADWPRITEGAKETRRATCQRLDCKELF